MEPLIMDSSGTLRILIFGFWIPVSGLVVLIICYLVYRQAQFRKVQDIQHEMEYRLARDKVEFERFASRQNDAKEPEILRAFMEASFADFFSRIRLLLEHDLGQRLSRIEQGLSVFRPETGLDMAAIEQSVKEATTKAVRALTTVNERNQKLKEQGITVEELIRELSHALNTPLSHMEVLAGTRLDLSTVLQQPNQDFITALGSLRASINICKSYLAAFRQVVLVSGQSLLWSPSSIGSALQAACSVYADSDDGLEFDIRVSDQVQGYSNNLIVAILLPLLENAIQASPKNSQIIIVENEGEQKITISVGNVTSQSPDPAQMFKRGYTTKGGQHEGQGLSIVQSLISVIPGAAIDTKISDSFVELFVTLPKGKAT